MVSEKKMNVTGLLMSLFIVALLVISVVALASSFNTDPSGTQSKKKYGDYEFLITERYLRTDFEGLELRFYHYPEEVSYTNVNPVIEKLKKGGEVYSTSDPELLLGLEVGETQFEIDKISGIKHGTFLNVSFTEENDFERPPITCENATPSTPVIFFNLSNSTSEIVEKNDCVIVNFQTDLDFYRIRDKIIYDLIEIPLE